MREVFVRQLLGGSSEVVSVRLRLSVASLVTTCAFAFGCSSTNKPIAEAPPAAPSATVAQSQDISKLPPPELNQVQEAVKRVFKESVAIDAGRDPAFVAGDFNGDQSQDIAVVLKPAPAKLSELNGEFPNWILRDLSGPKAPGSPSLLIAQDEPLLAVIHGYGPSGWRDAQATQTFLLKNAAGSNMKVQSARNFRSANVGKKLPSLRGDVVAEILGGRQGWLYFGNSTYAWYDPRTFTGEPVPMRGHGGQEKK